MLKKQEKYIIDWVYPTKTNCQKNSDFLDNRKLRRVAIHNPALLEKWKEALQAEGKWLQTEAGIYVKE